MAQALQWLLFYLKKNKVLPKAYKVIHNVAISTSSPDMPPSIYLCSGNTGLFPMPGTQLRYLFIKHSALAVCSLNNLSST